MAGARTWLLTTGAIMDSNGDIRTLNLMSATLARASTEGLPGEYRRNTITPRAHRPLQQNSGILGEWKAWPFVFSSGLGWRSDSVLKLLISKGMKCYRVDQWSFYWRYLSAFTVKWCLKRSACRVSGVWHQIPLCCRMNDSKKPWSDG